LIGVKTKLPKFSDETGSAIDFTYDNAGNIISTGSTTYQADAANRLKSVNNGSLGSYGYDGNGKRVKKGESGTTTYYVISSVLGSVMEVTSSGVQRAYVMSNGAVVAQLNPNGQFYWLHLDHLGSGRKMTDTSGTMVYRAEFDPYGKLLYEWSSPSNLNTKKFTGYERDAATNLDYAQARMYSSDWGRFMSPDPIGMKSAKLTSPKSLNRYAYVGGDPINFVDRNGTDLDYTCDIYVWTDGEGNFEVVKDCYLDGPDGPDKGGGGGGQQQQQQQQQQVALSEALTRTIEMLKLEPCAKLFGLTGQDAISRLEGATITFEDFNRRSQAYRNGNGNGDYHWVGASASINGTRISINTSGPFVDGKIEFLNGEILSYTDLPGRPRLHKLSIDSLRAIILLHELGHIVGVFGSDLTDTTINLEHTEAVLKNCLQIAPV
jgi:RHS repeat-associated protein